MVWTLDLLFLFHMLLRLCSYFSSLIFVVHIMWILLIHFQIHWFCRHLYSTIDLFICILSIWLFYKFYLSSDIFQNFFTYFIYFKRNCPGWCDSVDWVPACKPKGHQFDSQSGHMPGLCARSSVGGHVRGNHTLMFLSLSLSLPL